MNNQQLKNRIMRRVYVIWFWNRSKPVIFLQLPLILLFLVLEHEYVAFKAVASNSVNALGSPASVMHYVVSAFSRTEPLVAFLAAAIGLFVILSLNSIARNLIAILKTKEQSAVRIDK